VPTSLSAVIDEAPTKSTEHGLAPEGGGWFVVNAREARWLDDGGLGYYTPFEGEERFPRLGINLAVLEPGQPNGMYHGEQDQEDFLVLAGECLLLVEGQERRLRAWDFVHCPPWTEHIFVGAGDGPCTILMVSTRSTPDDVIYPESELAQRHGAGVEEETKSAAEAYKKFPNRKQPTPYRDGWLPDF
jgi:uncharacterized cupin superfamily protein